MTDQLGSRMKDQYESRTRYKLMRRCPTIIRLDGKAFHTYTKGLDKPFDEGLMKDMVQTAKFLCEEIQGAKFGYVQSDEISILITDFDKLQTSAWFDNNIQKIVSVAASMATAKLNKLRLFRSFGDALDDLNVINGYDYEQAPKLAFFDARVFQISDYEEVVNYFIWRQQDATRNSIQMLAQSLYSHKELLGKNNNELQELCFQKGHNWNNLSDNKKRGTCLYKMVTLDGVLNYVEYMSMSELNASVEAWSKNQNVELRSYWHSTGAPKFTEERFFIKRLLL